MIAEALYRFWMRTTSKVCAELPWERVPKHRKAGQSTSEHSREPGMCGTGGLASARRLCPYGMVLYFGRTRLDQGPARMHKNKTKEGNKMGARLLDIMARNPIYYKGLYFALLLRGMDHCSAAQSGSVRELVEACGRCGRQWKQTGSRWKLVKVMEDVGKQWKTCGRQERGWKGCGRFGRGPEGHGKVWKRWEGTGR